MVGTFTQSMRAPVEEVYDSVSKLRGDKQPGSEVKMRSHGSCPPFGAVQRFWIFPEGYAHAASVLETSIGKFVRVPEAMEVFAATVMVA
jgi:hypothetical protein